MRNSSVRIEWRSKAPHTTRFLVIDHPDKLPPGKLLSELEAIGFAGDGLLGPSPVNGRRETTVGKRGTGLFGGWTQAERQQNVAAAQKILTANGFSTPRWRKLTAAELL